MQNEFSILNLSNKKILITGGSGSLGTGLLKRIKAKEVKILSRSEIGQDKLRKEYSNVEFILGDIADLRTCIEATKGIDIVIHAAAFKYLDLAEKQPRQCVLTNIIGSLNIIEACKQNNVSLCVGISTDKVAYARNVYGCTKHIMEKLFLEANQNSYTKFCCVRYGNVLGTNGSVLTIWQRQKDKGEKITITDKRMTRFFFTLNEAIDLIFYALKKMKGGEIFIKPMKGYKIEDLAKEFAVNSEIIETGLRAGEKLHECLVADYETIYLDTNKEIWVIKSDNRFPLRESYTSDKLL